jgi:predicted alpha/beta hydrolase family esterase
MSFRILTVPGFHGSGDAHWQTWLEKELPNVDRVRGIDWESPVVKAWARAVTRALDEDPVPTVVVAHSFGCLASALAIANRPNLDIAAVFVAPAQPERFAPFGLRDDRSLPSIASYLPDLSLQVPGVLIGSQNDPWMKLQHAYAWARRWNLAFHDAGAVGHINIESGFGPWPWIKGVVESIGERLAESQADNVGARDKIYHLRQPVPPASPQKILFYT